MLTNDTIYVTLKGLERLAVSEGVLDPQTLEPTSYRRKLLLRSVITSMLVKASFQYVASDLPNPRVTPNWTFKEVKSKIVKSLSPATHHAMSTAVKVHQPRWNPKESVLRNCYNWAANVEQMCESKFSPKMLDRYVISLVKYKCLCFLGHCIDQRNHISIQHLGRELTLTHLLDIGGPVVAVPQDRFLGIPARLMYLHCCIRSMMCSR